MNRRLKIAFITLLIILLAIISFVGIYVQDTKFMKNVIPEYQLGMDLEGYRAITVTPNEETETIYYDADGNEVEEEVEGGTSETVVTNADALTTENFEKTKKLIEDRLSQLAIAEYLVRLDEENGNITVHIPEDGMTDLAAQFLYTRGEFTIENEDGEVLLDNSNLETVRVGYNNTTTGTAVYLSFQFNKDSIEKLREISTTYIPESDSTTTNETNANETVVNDTAVNDTATNTTAEEQSEESTAEEQTSLGQVSINIDGSPLLETTFSEEIENGQLLLTLGTSTDSATINSYIEQGSNIAILVNNGPLPLDYNLEQNRYIQSDITLADALVPAIILGAIFIIAIIALLLKYKKLGLLGVISFVGYMAILLIIVRYTNLIITIEGILAIILSAVLNYILLCYTMSTLKKQEKDIVEYKKAYNNVMLSALFVFLPILVIGIACSFANWLPIYSFGTILFWGIFVMALYHASITRVLFINSIKSKK